MEDWLRAKYSRATKKVWAENPEARARMLKGLRSPKRCKAVSIGMMGNKNAVGAVFTPERRAAISKGVSAAWAAPDAKWRSQSWHKKRSQASKEISEETRKKISDASKRMWADPEYRKKIVAGHHDNSRGPGKESTLEQAVVAYARRRGVYVFKLNPNHGVGAPDRIFMIKGGRPLLIEFKRPGGGDLRKLQAYTIQQLKKAGYDVIIENNKESAIAAIETRIKKAAQVSKARRRVAG